VPEILEIFKVSAGLEYSGHGQAGPERWIEFAKAISDSFGHDAYVAKLPQPGVKRPLRSLKKAGDALDRIPMSTES
jgi:hypothetical protein